jgi:glycosyltransferase involved in cell wall biosynthesis/SAM-dependent methyltransferase
MNGADERTGEARIADALVLCMTTGMSLRAWREAGVLDREWAIYARLAPLYGMILVLTYGGEDDAEIARESHAEVVCPEAGERVEQFLAAAPARVLARLAAWRCESAVVKTNQHEGGPAAISLARALRAAGLRTSLIARAGYPWSRFEAWKHGHDSSAAMQAAAAEGDLCRWADLVVCTTGEACEDLAWRHALPADRFAVVPNYVLPDAFDLSRASSTRGAPPVILSAGRLEPQKRFDLLIRATAELPRGARSPSVRIIGEGPERESLAALARALGVRLDLPGRVPHERLLREMASCAIYTQCSRFEGHPKALLEAMATAAPVVITDSPGLGGVVEHGVAGLTVDRAGARLAAAMHSLLESPPLRLRLGAEARRAIRDACSLDAVAAKEFEVHRAAVRSARGASASRPAMGAVRWDAALLHEPRAAQVEAWRASLHGFSRRLSPRDRATFLLSLDDPIYQMQGPAAIEADGGLHPKHRLMRYHDFFVERIGRGERVLDLGSGVGALAASIAERCGAAVVGVEIERAHIDNAVQIAQQRGLAGSIEYIRGDITSRRVEGTFDVVVLSNVLEHLRDRPALLRAWAEWYAPTRFLIRVPAFDRDWKVPFKRELGVEWRLDDTHELEYTRQSLEQELRDAGLNIGECVTRWGEYWVEALPVRAAQPRRSGAARAAATL